MSSGAGIAGAGVSYAGFGVPTSGITPANATLPDTITNAAQSGRFLQLSTGDYAMTSDGRLYGMNTVPQLVQLALSTNLGSAAQPDLGQTYATVQDQSPNIVQDMTARVTAALAYVIAQGFVQLDEVVIKTIAANPDAVKLFAKWTDLTTGQPQTTPIGP